VRVLGDRAGEEVRVSCRAADNVTPLLDQQLEALLLWTSGCLAIALAELSIDHRHAMAVAGRIIADE
jgi:hypothetical protein